MIARSLLLVLVALSLSGCIATPRIEMVEKIEFNYQPPSKQPMTRADLLCCYDCTA